MRSREKVLFDIENWRQSGVYGSAQELAVIAELLLDFRDLLTALPEKITGEPNIDWTDSKLFGKADVSEEDLLTKKDDV